MSNTSATGGYIVPTGQAVPPEENEDDAFLDFLHDVIQGITGLKAENIRPQFQLSPPTIPGRNIDWVGFGVTNRNPDQTGYEAHSGDGDGATALIVYEDADLICSFYGPRAENNATLLRSGLLIGQNRDVLTSAQVAIKRFAGPQRAPLLLKENWLYRSDLTVTLRRQIRRVYPILTIVEGHGIIVNDHPARSTPFEAGA